MNVFSKFDELIKSVEEALEKAPVSEAQRRAMHAAANGNSSLGIPKSVGKDFSDKDTPGKLPEKAKKNNEEEPSEDDEAVKAEKKAPVAIGANVAPKPPKAGGTIDYSQMNKPKKTPESQQATLTYNSSNPTAAPKYTAPTEKPVASPVASKPKMQEANTAAAMARVAEHKRQAGLVRPELPRALETMKERQKVKKSEDFGKFTPEALTKSIRAKHTDGEISEMLKAAVDEGRIHRNVLVEWINHRTINPAVISLVDEE